MCCAWVQPLLLLLFVVPKPIRIPVMSPFPYSSQYILYSLDLLGGQMGQHVPLFPSKSQMDNCWIQSVHYHIWNGGCRCSVSSYAPHVQVFAVVGYNHFDRKFSISFFCSHLGHNNRAKNRRSHQARKEIGKLLFLHVKLKLDCFWIHTTILGRLYYTRTTAASSLCYVPKCKCLYSRSRRWDALWITLW